MIDSGRGRGWGRGRRNRQLDRHAPGEACAIHCHDIERKVTRRGGFAGNVALARAQIREAQPLRQARVDAQSQGVRRAAAAERRQVGAEVLADLRPLENRVGERGPGRLEPGLLLDWRRRGGRRRGGPGAVIARGLRERGRRRRRRLVRHDDRRRHLRGPAVMIGGDDVHLGASGMLRRSLDGASAVAEVGERHTLGRRVDLEPQAFAPVIGEIGQLRPIGRPNRRRRQIDERLRRVRRHGLENRFRCRNLLILRIRGRRRGRRTWRRPGAGRRARLGFGRQSCSLVFHSRRRLSRARRRRSLGRLLRAQRGEFRGGRRLRWRGRRRG